MKLINPVFRSLLPAVAGLCLLAAAACSQPPVVKPRGYLRTDFAEKTYQMFDSAGYPYRFQYPVYARVVPDRQSYQYEPFWVNIQLPAYRATVHISYKQVQNNLPALLDDTYHFVYRHTIKADEITEQSLTDDRKKIYGLLYEIDGDVASSVQFYVTDSVQHFLRGSLYFLSTPNVDSLAPSIAFLTADIQHLIATLEWK